MNFELYVGTHARTYNLYYIGAKVTARAYKLLKEERAWNCHYIACVPIKIQTCPKNSNIISIWSVCI